MKTISTLGAVLMLVACGGEPEAEAVSQAMTAEPAAAAPTAAAPAGEMQVPDWFHVDEAGRTVHMTVTAGLTNAKNYWNFNGGYDGNMTITVPEGFTVTVDLVNKDPNMAHSLGISEGSGSFGAMVAPTPVFEGAISSDPTNVVGATKPGESETIQFVASTAGEYVMVCYIPGHAATGMWVYFHVSSDGTFGVQGG